MHFPQSEIHEFMARTGTWILAIGIGIIAKISTELMMKRKVSFIQWIAIVGISIFFGYLSAVWCDQNGWVSQGRYIVPVVTLMGEKIVIYMAANYQRIGDALLSIFTKNK